MIHLVAFQREEKDKSMVQEEVVVVEEGEAVRSYMSLQPVGSTIYVQYICQIYNIYIQPLGSYVPPTKMVIFVPPTSRILYIY